MDGEILFEHELCNANFDKLELHFLGDKTYKVKHVAAFDVIKSICRK